MARIHNKIKNIRENHLHQISHEIIHENQVVVSEDLSVVSMLKNHSLAKSISNCSWGELIRQFKYKSDWNNRVFIQVDRFFPSSKMCSDCGFVLEDLPLNTRTWTCPVCKTIHDRDINAAINIKKQGINLMSGCGTQSDSKQKRVESLRVRKAKKPNALKFFS